MNDEILVVYYSRTGTTKKVAKEMAGRLGTEIEEIIDKKNRKGIIGWLSAVRDAGARRLTEIEKPKRDPALYSLVVIGTPVWNNTISTPIRTYIVEHRKSFKDVAVFCTGDAEDNKALEEMESLIGKKSKASLKLRRKQQVETGEYAQKVNEFIEQLRGKRGHP